jgi:hypothetical protein
MRVDQEKFRKRQIMKPLVAFLAVLLLTAGTYADDDAALGVRIAVAARQQVGVTKEYDPAYTALKYQVIGHYRIKDRTQIGAAKASQSTPTLTYDYLVLALGGDISDFGHPALTPGNAGTGHAARPERLPSASRLLEVIRITVLLEESPHEFMMLYGVSCDASWGLIPVAWVDAAHKWRMAKILRSGLACVSHDYERQAHSGETMVNLAMIGLMLTRLSKSR